MAPQPRMTGAHFICVAALPTRLEPVAIKADCIRNDGLSVVKVFETGERSKLGEALARLADDVTRLSVGAASGVV
jgi:hypothetical protein